ncbi:hypothetical protein JCM17961_09320 [Endothiovibrio diazotrophicus]
MTGSGYDAPRRNRLPLDALRPVSIAIVPVTAAPTRSVKRVGLGYHAERGNRGWVRSESNRHFFRGRAWKWVIAGISR